MDETFDLVIKDGKKFSNLKKVFGEERVFWESKEKEWNDDHIPEDLKIIIKLDDGTYKYLGPDDNIIEL